MGRQRELDELAATLAMPAANRGAALLVRAEYGAGKSHLLQVVREAAREQNYAVALVTVDSNGGVRFNRMDTVFSAVCREIELPNVSVKGVGTLLQAFADIEPSDLSAERWVTWESITELGSWTFSEFLSSPAVYVALRAWVATPAGSMEHTLVSEWLSSVKEFESRRAELYSGLVAYRGCPFRDPRAERQFYSDDVFKFTAQGHAQAWAGLSDLATIAEVAGYSGLILLFDEFEDVITNLNNRTYQQGAFLNLFRFFQGDRYPGMAYFAVTPEFAHKCQKELLDRSVYSFPLAKFDELTHFSMTQIDRGHFGALASRVRDMHGHAYAWPAGDVVTETELKQAVADAYRPGRDQVRQGIRGIVEYLDSAFDDYD